MSGSAASAIGTAAETMRDMRSTLPRACSIRPSRSDQVRAGITKQNASFAIGRESRCFVCFGVGLITGVVIALSLRPDDNP